MQHDARVCFELQSDESGLPLVVRSLAKDVTLPAWIRESRELIEAKLCHHGAVLFRGFDVRAQADFERCIDAVAPARLSYVYRSTPRTSVGQGVYTATEYPKALTIPLHCENAYQRDWPMKLLFFCLQPAEQGGATTLASTVRVTARLGEELVEEFARRKVMYVRNYGDGVDLPWETVFQTNRRDEVEEYCQENSIEIEWKGDGGLRTRQVCEGVAEHPRTKQRIFFNQAHLFHISSLDKKTRTAMLRIFKEEDLPRNAYYGDGAPIEEAVLDKVREAFYKELLSYPWQMGDILLVDNMLAAHGRSPYAGPRRVLVAMAEPYSTVRVG